MRKYRVTIVDDEKLFTVGLKMIIENHPSLVVNHIFHNGQELLDYIDQGNYDSDIILLDLSMPVLDGVDTLLELQKRKHIFKVVILTSHYNESIIIKLLDEGACSFLAKNENPKIVIETLYKVAEKGYYIDDYIMQLMRNRRKLASHQQLQEELSKREKEILLLICQEFTNKEIAEKLYISQRTVEGHRNRILEKTRAKNTAGIVLFAVEHNLIEINISKY